jgi:cytochrome oxidase assembly protein ShyY1
MSKEVLIPKTKVIDGVSVLGYDVVNPLYCYEGGKISMKNALTNDCKDMISVDRSAIIVVRGWIPAEYRDKRSRPQEATASKQLVKVVGTWLRGKDIHDYKRPNNPDNNEWHNLCLEDIALFWDLPNVDEQKFYYFRAVHLDSTLSGVQSDIQTPVKPDRKDDIIEDYYGWKVHDLTNKGLMYGVGAFSSVCWVVGAVATALV